MGKILFFTVFLAVTNLNSMTNIREFVAAHPMLAAECIHSSIEGHFRYCKFKSDEQRSELFQLWFRLISSLLLHESPFIRGLGVQFYHIGCMFELLAGDIGQLSKNSLEILIDATSDVERIVASAILSSEEQDIVLLMERIRSMYPSAIVTETKSVKQSETKGTCDLVKIANKELEDDAPSDIADISHTKDFGLSAVIVPGLLAGGAALLSKVGLGLSTGAMVKAAVKMLKDATRYVILAPEKQRDKTRTKRQSALLSAIGRTENLFERDNTARARSLAEEASTLKILTQA